MSFLMQPEKEGRVKYLLLTFLPPLALRKAMEPLGVLGIALPLALLLALAYFLVLKKNHTIEVGDFSVSETDFRGNCTVITNGRIRSWRKNLLGEIVLLDKDGKVLLTVESNLSNRNRFAAWLESHHITQKDKE